MQNGCAAPRRSHVLCRHGERLTTYSSAKYCVAARKAQALARRARATTATAASAASALGLASA